MNMSLTSSKVLTIIRGIRINGGHDRGNGDTLLDYVVRTLWSRYFIFLSLYRTCEYNIYTKTKIYDNTNIFIM